MIWRDTTYCASADECGNRECVRWIDFGEAADEAISLAHLKTDTCGWVPVDGPEASPEAL